MPRNPFAEALFGAGDVFESVAQAREIGEELEARRKKRERDDKDDSLRRMGLIAGLRREGYDVDDNGNIQGRMSPEKAFQESLPPGIQFTPGGETDVGVSLADAARAIPGIGALIPPVKETPFKVTTEPGIRDPLGNQLGVSGYSAAGTPILTSGVGIPDLETRLKESQIAANLALAGQREAVAETGGSSSGRFSMKDIQKMLGERTEILRRIQEYDAQLSRVRTGPAGELMVQRSPIAAKIAQDRAKLANVERTLGQAVVGLRPAERQRLTESITDPGETALLGLEPPPAKGGPPALTLETADSIRQKYLSGEYGQPGSPEAVAKVQEAMKRTRK